MDRDPEGQGRDADFRFSFQKRRQTIESHGQKLFVSALAEILVTITLDRGVDYVDLSKLFGNAMKDESAVGRDESVTAAKAAASPPPSTGSRTSSDEWGLPIAIADPLLLVLPDWQVYESPRQPMAEDLEVENSPHPIGTKAGIETNWEKTESVAKLGENLDDKDYSVRGRAIEALARLGETSIPFLIEALHHRSAHVRGAAAEALGRIGPRARAAIPELSKALDDKANVVRWGVAFALCMIGPTPDFLPALVNLLQDPDYRVRACAAFALGKIGPTGAEMAVPALAKSLKDGFGSVRAVAAVALARMGDKAKKVVPELKKILADKTEREYVIKWATKALKYIRNPSAGIGHAAANEVELLREALKSSNQKVRFAAIRGLDERGPRAAKAIPDLIAILKDENEVLRAAASRALGEIGRRAEAAVMPLTDSLRDSCSHVRWGAAYALRKIGPKSGVAIGRLTQALRDDVNARVRAEAAHALNEGGSQVARTVIQELTRALSDGDGQVRRWAAHALNLGPRAESAAPRLVEMLLEERSEIRREVIRAIISIGTRAAPSLVDALQHGNGRVREGAAWVLRTLCSVHFSDIQPDLAEEHFFRIDNLRKYVHSFKAHQIYSHLRLLGELNSNQLSSVYVERLPDPNFRVFDVVVAGIDLKGTLRSVAGCLTDAGFAIRQTEVVIYDDNRPSLHYANLPPHDIKKRGKYILAFRIKGHNPSGGTEVLTAELRRRINETQLQLIANEAGAFTREKADQPLTPTGESDIVLPQFANLGGVPNSAPTANGLEPQDPGDREVSQMRTERKCPSALPQHELGSLNPGQMVDALKARTIANEYIVFHLPNLLTASRNVHSLSVSGLDLWIVPIVLATPHFGEVGEVGVVAIDARTSAIVSSTSHAEVIDAAEKLYETHRQQIEATFHAARKS